MIGKYRPAVVWLFAAKQVDDYPTWAQRVREASPGTIVWVQVGSVKDAVARKAKTDVLVTQGSDAGGYGLAKSAGSGFAIVWSAWCVGFRGIGE